MRISLGDSTSSESDPLQAFHQFAGYDLSLELGRGGMGVVYEAREIRLNRVVALKMLHPSRLRSSADLQRFRLESEAIAALDHPNILPIYTVGDEQGQPFFTMKLAEGGSLASAPLIGWTLEQRVRLFLPIADAVQYAHERGIQHRDLKPANILLDQNNRPYVSDFGLAKFRDSEADLTLSTTVLGSPAYMAPEQARGDAKNLTVRADVYGLGAILFELITGRPPFAANSTLEVLRQVTEQDPPRPSLLDPAVDRDLETICLKCLRKLPADRFDSALAFGKELQRWLNHEPILSRPVSPPARFYRWCKRKPALAAALALLVISMIAGIASVLVQSSHIREARRITQMNLYAADMQVASQALDRGDFGVAQRALEAHFPSSDIPDNRGFEWYLLRQLVRGEQLATLSGHQWIVTCTAFSPDGQVLASGSQDSTIRLWDIANSRVITNLHAHQGAVWSLQFSADGKSLFSSGSDSKVLQWDCLAWTNQLIAPGQLFSLSTNRLLALSPSNPFFWQKPGPISVHRLGETNNLFQTSVLGRRLAFSPDGAFLAIAGPSSGVELWDASGRERLRTFATSNSVWSLTFSPSGQWLAASGWNKGALVWDLRATNAPIKLRGHSMSVWSVAFSPDSRYLATASSDQTIRLWDTASWENVRALRGHRNEVWSALFSPDSQSIASGGKDLNVMLWSVLPESERHVLRNRTWNRPVLSLDGRTLITSEQQGAYNTPLVYSLPHSGDTQGDHGRAPLKQLPLPFQHAPLAFVSGGSEMLFLDNATGAINRCSTNAGALIATMNLDIPPEELPLHRWGASPDFSTFFTAGKTGSIFVWNSATLKLLRRVAGPAPPLRVARLSREGHWLAAATERENVAEIWNVKTGERQQFAGHKDFISGFDFSPDNQQLATGSVDATIKLWDLATGALQFTLLGHMEEASDVAYSPDGRTLASLGNLHAIKFWHLPTRREVASIQTPEAEALLFFSRDGQSLFFSTRSNRLVTLEAPSR